MARKVIWSQLAQQRRMQILDYWVKRTKSKTYSIKLNTLFKEATYLLTIHPEIGRMTDIPNVRLKIVRDYLIFYNHTKSTIHILTVWDSRQNPKNFKLV